MQASIGVSAGPVRLSQGIGLPSLAGIMALGVVTLAAPVVMWAVHTADPPPPPVPLTRVAESDRTQVLTVGPDTGDLTPGTYQTQAPATANDYHPCTWSVRDGSETVGRGQVEAGRKRSVTVHAGQFFYTGGCGAWVLQS